MSGSSVVEDWSSQMDRHHSATAGSAAEVSEVVIVDDPDFDECSDGVSQGIRVRVSSLLIFAGKQLENGRAEQGGHFFLLEKNGSGNLWPFFF